MNIEPLAEPQPETTSDTEFKAMMMRAIPQLRAFARGLSGSVDLADDLVQEAMLKAWAARASFQAGTNFRGWIFTILRNKYYSQMRRRKFVGEWDDVVADRLLAAPAGQEKTIELRDMLRALQQLPAAQREALILVGAGGISYEETSAILGVAIGTIKSRVARGRDALDALICGGQLKQTRRQFSDDGNPVVSIFTYLESIKQRERPALKHDSDPLLAIAA